MHRPLHRPVFATVAAMVLASVQLGCPAPSSPAPSADETSAGSSGGTASADNATPAEVAPDDVGTPTPPFQGEVSPDAQTKDVTGRYGGTFILGMPGGPSSWNPITAKGASDQNYASLFLGVLTGYDNEKWEANLELAKSFDVSDDGLTWTYHLRQGIQWSDGEPFDADDVLFTFAVVFDKNVPSGQKDLFKIGDAAFPDVEKVDQHTVRFTLHAVDVLFDSHVGSCRMLPEHKLRVPYEAGTFEQTWKVNEDLANVVGLGPFRIVDYKADEAVTFERNPYYWKVDKLGNRLPYLDRIVVRIVPDQNTIYTKFVAGDLHTLEPVRPEDYSSAKGKAKEAGFTVAKPGLSLNTSCLTFNRHPGTNADGKPYVAPHKRVWFSNVKFRQAISHACDRRSMVRNMLEGKGLPIYGRVPPSNKVWYVKDVPEFAYDLEKAGALLDEIGYVDHDGDGIREDTEGNPLEFTINTNSENTTRIGICTIIQADLQKIGVTANVQPLTFNSLVTILRDTHDFETYVLGWASGVPPDPLQSKNLLLSSGRLHPGYPGQEKPFTEWEGKIDKLVEQLSSTLDKEERKKINGQISVIWGEKLPEIYLFSANLYVAAYDFIGNWNPTLLRPHNWWNIDQIYIKTKG